MRRHLARISATRQLGSMAVGAVVAALPIAAMTSGIATDDSAGPDDVSSPWSPIAMIGTEERHDVSTGSGVRAVRAESHDRPEVAALDKAARLADRIAAIAELRASAVAQGAPGVVVSPSGQVYALPTTGTLTSSAGPRWGTTHYGLDIANQVGTPVFAVSAGTVIDSGPATGFGLWVRVRHPDGSISVYGHIDRSLVRVGQVVRAGDRIALMGNRGQSTGPHLHLEIWTADGRKVDPQTWLSRRGLRVD